MNIDFKKRAIILITCVSAFVPISMHADDYHSQQANQYSREAQYYQRQADGYRREAQYYLKKAEGYEREAAYYTKKGDVSRAKDYQRRASRAMDDYRTQMRYAANASDKAADYFKRASKALAK